MKYLVVIEKTLTGYSAYSPDLPGCIATAETKDEVQREMQDAVAFHLADELILPGPYHASPPAICDVLYPVKEGRSRHWSVP